MLLMNSIKLRLNLHQLASVLRFFFFFFFVSGMPQGQINVNEGQKESGYIRFYWARKRAVKSGEN